jgi:hypothetical protein
MDKINQFRDCGYELIAFLTTLFKQQFPGLAVMAYQCRNYGDVARIKGAVADALVKNTALRLDNILGSRETTNDNKPSAIKTEH